MFFESEDDPLTPGGAAQRRGSQRAILPGDQPLVGGDSLFPIPDPSDPFGINRRRRPSLLDLAIPPTENNRGLLWDPADGFAKGPQPSQGFDPPKLPKLTGLDDDTDPTQTAGGLNRGGDPGRGEGSDRTVNQPGAPFGPSAGADPWAAGNMADVLLRKNDYADAVTHYQGQAKTDPAGTRAELSAVHDRMANADPASAAKFVTQMGAAGLTAAKTEPPAEVGLTPLWIDIYNTHQEDDSFDPKESDTIQVADASERTNARFDPRIGDAKSPPDWKKDTFKSQPGAWVGFNTSVGKLPGAGDNEKFVYGQIYAAEGGNAVDPASGASSGITRQTLIDAQNAGAVPGLDKVRQPKDLTADQRAGIMRWYFDNSLRKVGGSAALETVGDPQTAAALADTLYRHGSTGGANLIRAAISGVDGNADIQKSGSVDSATFSAVTKLAANPESRDKLLNKLADLRDAATHGYEADRIDHYRPMK
ncbi:hypothetical protein [Magnetospirillum molischianum]|uniref:Uncharacterized protein n=1 Tax=Magnetospirillum molischianum DSM 120 TaxID=1150626 RepID=H8FWJ2_MAGML|nr:hypothetical protein [Magnetospirillum molischianum]CCG42730.1 hypothetical protein PHAMO_420012 [Magnetospirillum molischianum DSM 120]